jgi:hypothetical protein
MLERIATKKQAGSGAAWLKCLDSASLIQST